MKHIRPLVKYHGGKGRLHQWVISHFPPHKTFVEPFGGAASVLLNKSPVAVEVYNELEFDMFNLMHIVKSDFDNFSTQVAAFEYSKPTFLAQKELWLNGKFNSNLDRAVCFYAVKRMSRGGLCQRFSWSNRIYSTGPAEEHCWKSSLINLKPIRDRLSNVILRNEDAFSILSEYLNNEECLLYLDPPYLTSTRVYKKAYDHEFNIKDHEHLAKLILPAKAKIILSGYPSEPYAGWFADWYVYEKDVANHSSQYNGKAKVRKQEVLWANHKLSMN